MFLFVVVVAVCTVALCVWAAKVGKINQEKRRNGISPEKEMFVELSRALGGTVGGDVFEVKYLGPGSTKQGRCGLKGAVFGGIFAGPIGAVIGAAMPDDEKQKLRFAVKYSDGSVVIREVYPGSREYKRLNPHIKWDENT